VRLAVLPATDIAQSYSLEVSFAVMDPFLLLVLLLLPCCASLTIKASFPVVDISLLSRYPLSSSPSPRRGEQTQ
jgi:hypothetical protein